MKKDASRFSPKGVLFHRTFFTAPLVIDISNSYDICPERSQGQLRNFKELFAERNTYDRNAPQNPRQDPCHAAEKTSEYKPADIT